MRLAKTGERYSLNGTLDELRAISARLAQVVAGADESDCKANVPPGSTHIVAIGLPEVDGFDEFMS